MAQETTPAAATARTIVLAGFAILAAMGVGVLAVILYLYVVGREPPQGLIVIFTGTAAVTVTTFSSLLKAYMDKVTP